MFRDRRQKKGEKRFFEKLKKHAEFTPPLENPEKTQNIKYLPNT